MTRAFVVGASGFGLIAVCYGLARYAFGLFLPQISSELALTPSLAGVISGGGFLSYCVAVGAAAWLTERLGSRPVAAAAGVVAALGMAGIALAPSAIWLAIGVIVAGASTGLASPPLAAAVKAAVPPARQDAVNTVINAGTAAGIALSGPVAMLSGAQWRMAFMGFAGLALLMAMATLRTIQGETTRAAPGAALLPACTPDLIRLVVACLLTGVASAVVWTFGADLVTARLGWDSGQVGILWIAVGAAGIAGAAAGHLIARFGINAVHVTFQLAMLTGIGFVGCDIGTAPLVLAGAGLLAPPT